MEEKIQNLTETNSNDIMTNAYRPWGMDLNQFCMLMHLAQFAGFIIPFGGLLLPIVMWTTNKEHSKIIDQHGKNILNWTISCYIYIFASIILMFFLIGFLTLFGIAICSLIFSIVGAIRANEGIIYHYPLSISFIK